VFFRAETVGAAVAYLRAMAGGAAADPSAYTLQWYLTTDVILALVLGAIGSAPVMRSLGEWATRTTRHASARGVLWEAAGVAALAMVFVAALLQVAAQTYNPFIYFRF
jgi:alginate O-acetyltransferase complex protein AlgI